MKIVVLEDDKIAQIGIKKIFGAVDIDIELVMASNGQEGLDYFDKSEAEGTYLDFSNSKLKTMASESKRNMNHVFLRSFRNLTSIKTQMAWACR